MATAFDLIFPFLQPIVPLLTDPTISEVMVNNSGAAVFIERDGRLLSVPGVSIAPDKLLAGIQQVARDGDDDFTAERPILNARMEDGSRVAAVFDGVANGHCLTIRKFGAFRTLDALTAHHMLTLE